MTRITTRLAIGLAAFALTVAAADANMAYANILPKNDSPDPPLPPRMKVQPAPATVPDERRYFTADAFNATAPTGCDSAGNAARSRTGHPAPATTCR